MSAWTDAIAALTPVAWYRMNAAGSTLPDSVGSRNLAFAAGNDVTAMPPIILGDAASLKIHNFDGDNSGAYLDAVTWPEITGGEWSLVILGQGSGDEHFMVHNTTSGAALRIGVGTGLDVSYSGASPFHWHYIGGQEYWALGDARWMLVITLKSGDLHTYVAIDDGTGTVLHDAGQIASYAGALVPLTGRMVIGGTYGNSYSNGGNDRHGEIAVLGQGLTSTQVSTLAGLFAQTGGTIGTTLPRVTADIETISDNGVLGGFLPKVAASLIGNTNHGDVEATLPVVVAALAGDYTPAPDPIVITGSGVLSVVGDTITANPTITLMVLEDAIDRAPSTVDVSIVGGDPLAAFVLTVDGTTVLTGNFNSEGGLSLTTIPVMPAYGAAGSHTVEVSQVALTGDTVTGSDTFIVVRDPAGFPTTPDPDIAAAVVTDSAQHWVFQDPLPGGIGSWVMPANPRNMTAPHFEKSLKSRHTTAKSGQYHVTEGGQVVKQWQFGGYTPSETTVEQLKAYFALPRRIYIIDHRNRAWKVVIEALDIVPRLQQIYNDEPTDWGHDWTMTCTILDQNWTTPS